MDQFVKIAKLGSAVKEVMLDSGATVSDALDAADVDVDGAEIRVNGNPADGYATVRGGDIITLVPKIKGGF